MTVDLELLPLHPYLGTRIQGLGPTYHDLRRDKEWVIMARDLGANLSQALSGPAALDKSLHLLCKMGLPVLRCLSSLGLLGG